MQMDKAESVYVDNTIPKQYAPLTEVCFYILMALRKECYGYEIMQWTETVTDGQVKLQGGTIYNSLSRLERDGLIRVSREEGSRKYYQITEMGEHVLLHESRRLERIHRNSHDKVWKNKYGSRCL